MLYAPNVVVATDVLQNDGNIIHRISSGVVHHDLCFDLLFDLLFDLFFDLFSTFCSTYLSVAIDHIEIWTSGESVWCTMVRSVVVWRKVCTDQEGNLQLCHDLPRARSIISTSKESTSAISCAEHKVQTAGRLRLCRVILHGELERRMLRYRHSPVPMFDPDPFLRQVSPTQNAETTAYLIAPV